MHQEELKKILPHRDAMLLVDEAEVREGAAYGKKQIRGDEWFLQGHFPGKPVVPGVILCEILAQSAGVCLAGEMEAGKLPLFAGIDKAKFKRPVRPGDLLETRCEIKRRMDPFYFAEGIGTVAGEECVRATFSFALVDEKEVK